MSGHSCSRVFSNDEMKNTKLTVVKPLPPKRPYLRVITRTTAAHNHSISRPVADALIAYGVTAMVEE